MVLSPDTISEVPIKIKFIVKLKLRYYPNHSWVSFFSLKAKI